jgi:peptidoglycan/xylan/chitin deacetylase (PgdA/CDA1 family)
LAPYDILENVTITIPAGNSELVQLTVTPKEEGIYYAYIFATGDDNLVTDQMPWLYAFATKTSALPTELVESMNSLQNVPTSCDCVAFRMDDIQDFFTSEAQIDLINLFREENVPVTLGVIGGSLQIDKELIQFLQNSTSTGLLEIANHGWIHTPHFDMTVDEQRESIARANQHMKELFGVDVKTFIAPENAFNNDTLSVMRETGLTHFAGSAIFRADKPPYPLKNGDSIFHFPATAFDSDIEGGSTGGWTIFPNEQVISMINSSMEQYGFATVVMHPFAYYEKQDSGYVYHKEMIEQLRPLLKEVKKQFKTVKMNEIDKQGWIPKNVVDNSSVRHALALKSDGVIIASGADMDVKVGKERLLVERKGSSWGQPFVLTIPADVISQTPLIMLNDAVIPSMKWFDLNTKTWIVYADPPSSAESLRIIPESGIRDAKVQLPASADSYFSGKIVTIPYSIVNTGTVSSEFHVKYSLGNDTSTFVSNSAKIFLQKDENRSLQLNMTLPSLAGEYTLTVEVLADEGSNNVLSSASQNIIISRTISTDTLQKVPTGCDCVAFRVDDVQDFFARQAQIDLINIFLEEDSPVTIGIVAGALQHDTSLIKFLQNATSTGLVEVASKGWNHTIYSKKTINEQRDLMLKTNERMKTLFGVEIKTFVPPEYVFNNDTLSAMRETGLTHIVGSTFSNADTPPYPLKNGDTILHFPTTVFVSHYNGTAGEWKRLPNGELLDMIRTSINNNGFAVVSIPPVAHYSKNFTTYMSKTAEDIRALLKDVKKEFKIVKTNEIDDQGWIPANVVGEKDLYQHTLELRGEKIIIGSSADIDIEAREGKFFITRKGDTWDKPLLLWIPKAHVSQEPVIFANRSIIPSMKWYDAASETWIVYVDPPKSIASINVIPEFGPAVFLFATTFVLLLFMITIRRIRII